MSQPVRVPQRAAPRATKLLAEILGLGVLAQAGVRGRVLGGPPHMWLSWHQRLGDFIVVIPIVSLIVGLAARRHQPEMTSMLLLRIVLIALVIGTEAAGHAAGSLLVCKATRVEVYRDDSAR